MEGINGSDRGGVRLCESCSMHGSQHATLGSEQTVPEDEVIECANDASGRYRVSPDYGPSVAVWLCERHCQAYDTHIVETLATA